MALIKILLEKQLSNDMTYRAFAFISTLKELSFNSKNNNCTVDMRSANIPFRVELKLASDTNSYKIDYCIEKKMGKVYFGKDGSHKVMKDRCISIIEHGLSLVGIESAYGAKLIVIKHHTLG